MSLRPAFVVVTLALGGCSCADELPVGALPPTDAGGPGDAGDADGPPVIERPCGVPERRFTVPMDAPEVLGQRTAIRGAGNLLYLARAVHDASLTLFALDVTSESVEVVADVPIVGETGPAAIRVADSVDVLMTGTSEIEWVRIRDGGEVERFGYAAAPIPVFDAVPGPRGFIAVGESRLLHITPERVESSAWEHTGSLQVHAREDEEVAYVVMGADTDGPTLSIARLPAGDPLSIEPGWVEVFRGPAGEDAPTFDVHGTAGVPVVSWWRSELLDSRPTLGPHRLHLLWLDADGAPLGRWEGADGFTGEVAVVGDPRRQSLFAWLGPSDWSVRGSDAAWAFGRVAGPGLVSDLRVITNVRFGLHAPHDAWPTQEGAHAAALYRFSQVDVVVTCEGAE